jgi:phosphate/phosphite/phosphonate ABC transporter binding protein
VGVAVRVWLLGLAVWLVAACAIAPPAAPAKPRALVFGVQPYLTEPEMRDDFGPILAYLGKKLHQDVELKIVRDYADLGTQMQADGVDVGMFGPLAYVEAATGGYVEPLLAVKSHGSYYYHGVVVVRKDSRIVDLEGLRGRRFAFVDRQSASGFLFPAALMAGLGIQPDAYFEEVRFLGNHPSVIAAVLDGRADGGATYHQALREQAARGVAVENLTIVAETGPIPIDVIAVRRNLDPDLKEKVRIALSEMGYRLEGQTVLAQSKLGRGGFAPVGDKDFEVVRETIRLLAAMPPVRGTP